MWYNCKVIINMFIQSSECCHWCFSTDFCFYLTFWKVRKLGSILNVPEAFLKRHPFPGPGLAVRVLGDVTEGNALDILRQVLYLANACNFTCIVSKYLILWLVDTSLVPLGRWDIRSVDQGCWTLWKNLASFCRLLACTVCWGPRWPEDTFSCCCP